MLKIFSFSLIFIFYITQNFDSQTLEWQKHYSLNNYAKGQKIAFDRTENFYVCGSSADSLLLTKFNKDGLLLWAKTYNINGTYGIATDIKIKSNYIYIVGYLTVNNFRLLTTVKFDSSGNLIWVRSFQSDDNQIYNNAYLAIDSLNNLIVAGNLTNGTNLTDIYIIKYNNIGSLIWTTTINGPAGRNDYVGGLAIDYNNYIYLTGTACSQNSIYFQFYEYLTAKLNSSGQILWTKHNGNGYYNYASELILDDSLNVIVTGCINMDFCTIKYDNLGNTKWNKTYSSGNDSLDISNSLTSDIECNIYVTGILANNSSHASMGIIKYDQSGNQIWDKRYRLINSIWGNKTKFYENDGLYVVGTRDNNQHDILLYKLNSDGTSVFSTIYHYSYDDNPTDFIVDMDKSIYITGFNQHIGESYTDLLFLKYSQTLSIYQITSEIPQFYSLQQNYPNPFNPNTKIRFSLPRSSFTKIIIYDVVGKEINNLVNSKFSAGIYEAEFNASNLSSGIYFYKLITEDFTETKKMVLIK